MAGDVPRLRVLALHGMGTNSVVLRHQLKALTAACDSLDVVYLDGREECPGEPTVAKVFASAAPFRRYMTRSQLATGPVYEHIEEAVASVEAFLRENGPFDGLLGFSQGANLATLVAAHLLRRGSEGVVVPRFALLFCGTQFGWTAQVPLLFPVGCAPLALPSFHVLGALDPFLPTTEALLQLWQAEGRRRAVHSSGHRPLPPAGAETDALVAELRAFLLAQTQPEQ